MTIFRLVRELERLGHGCAVFVFDPFGTEDRPGVDLREEIQREFVPIQAPVFVGLDRFHSADVAIATNWWTAYPVSDLQRCLARAYLVQDFEPSFHPVSAASTWARSTYDMGLRCLVFTQWLADILRNECGVEASTFTYGTDTETYTFGPFDEREPGLVVLYARRETPRRAVELALSALKIAVERRPEMRVVLFGSGMRLDVPFPCEDVGVLKPRDLARLYRSANVGVALSMTNLSLVSLEMLASGLPLVELDGENVRSVLGASGELAMLAGPHPEGIADAVTALLDDPVGAECMAQRGRAFVEARGWDRSGRELAGLLGEFLAVEEGGSGPHASSYTE
jgi:glycosyltransferase involved in cell wall biosynthesis